MKSIEHTLAREMVPVALLKVYCRSQAHTKEEGSESRQQHYHVENNLAKNR